ncbi:MAG TPA: hypothetical protein VNN80_24920 [Polyangiaceae bacterium]|jgi:hypothetical protein|nr:hypothetical protein [Polyangiaceae bacterium]
MADRGGSSFRFGGAAAAACWAAALLGGCGVDEREVQAPAEESCNGSDCSREVLPPTGTNPEATSDVTSNGAAVPAQNPETPGASLVMDNPASSSVTSLADGVACLSESRGTNLLTPALFLVLDSSGSMEEAVGTGSTKWQAVQRALRAFLVETRESDLQVGLQFFPLLVPGSQWFCTSQADCGPQGGPCFLSTCLQGETITLCTSDADCGSMPDTNPCVNFGLCAGSDPASPTACVLPSTCGGALGRCEDFDRTCTNATDCNSARYAAPAVEIGPVAMRLVAIDAALSAQPPQGETPTVPALQGALDHARSWAQAHPDQSVSIVLATDGLPTDCNTPVATAPVATAPVPIDQVLAIAGQGLAGSTPIRTHVLGVFQPGDAASRANVDAIARAGGTENAVVIESNGEVEEGFLAALRSVRDTSSACGLDLQGAPGLDFAHADVTFEDGSGTRTLLPYVEGLLGCASTPQGWYYDTPPSNGVPTSVQLCPNVCQLVRASTAVGLQVEIGCSG